MPGQLRFRGTATSRVPLLLSLTKVLSAAASPLLSRSSPFSESAMILATNMGKDKHAADPPMETSEYVYKGILSMALILLGGVFAGLTLALMGSDEMQLRVLEASSSDVKEQRAAAKVLRLLNRGRHWVLVVLLLGNVITNEILPIVLDDVLGGGGVAAVFLSTLMIVIFGEIIPQSICVRYGLAIGGACSPFVLAIMYLFAPIAWPVAKLLDYVLGAEEGHTFRKAELKTFLQFHREGQEPLRDDEITILNGVLSLNDKKAVEIMTEMKDVLTLSADTVLDHDCLDEILLSGFSRIPVHEPGKKDNFVGMLLVKKLITYNAEECKHISSFPLLSFPEALPDINCFQALDYFQTGRAHLLLITEHPGKGKGALGVVSLEDLIEEILGEEIQDETDYYQDNRSHKVAKRSANQAALRGIVERHKKGQSTPSMTPMRRDDNFSSDTNMLDGKLIEIDGDRYSINAVPDNETTGLLANIPEETHAQKDVQK